MKELFYTIQSDLFRITAKRENWISILYYLYMPEFRFMFFLRIANYHYVHHHKTRLLIIRIFYRHYSIKYGYEIPYQCNIKAGLRLVHRGGVIINALAKINNNVTLLRGVTIGSNRRGRNKGAPTIGNNVWVGANAAIIGNVTIGDSVMIAPNSYINFDVPSHSICIGNPARIVSRENAIESYIDNPIEL